MDGEEAKEKNILDSVIYRYTTSSSQSEMENALLKETIQTYDLSQPMKNHSCRNGDTTGP